MSFVEQEDVFQAIEPVLRGVFEEFCEGQAGDAEVSDAYRIASRCWNTASDKPDLRNPLIIVDVTDVFKRDDVSFPRLQGGHQASGVVRAIPAPAAALSRAAFFDKLNDWAHWRRGAGPRLNHFRGRGW